MKGILLDNSNEPVIVGGTIQTGDSDAQNINLVVMAEKGEFKEYPILGAGLLRFVKSTDKTKSIKRETGIQLGYIGYAGANVSIDENGKLNIEL